MSLGVLRVQYSVWPETFTCGESDRGSEKVGCGRVCEAGTDLLLTQLFGPLCVDCWPKVRSALEQIVAREPRLSLGRTCSARAIHQHYRTVKAKLGKGGRR